MKLHEIACKILKQDGYTDTLNVICQEIAKLVELYKVGQTNIIKLIITMHFKKLSHIYEGNFLLRVPKHKAKRRRKITNKK